MPTLRFFGLCAFTDFGDEFEASMPTCMGHEATVFINPNDIVVPKDKRSRTTARIRRTSAAVQFEIPLEKGDRMYFSDGRGSPRWIPNERDQAIDVHITTNGRQLQKDQDAAVVALPDGYLSVGTDVNTYDIFRGGDLLEGDRDAPTSLVWQGSARVLVLASRKLGERTIGTLSPSADVTVTNVALAQGEVANEHFNCYYDRFLVPSPARPDRILPRQRRSEKIDTVDVYDCVPPQPLP